MAQPLGSIILTQESFLSFLSFHRVTSTVKGEVHSPRVRAEGAVAQQLEASSVTALSTCVVESSGPCRQLAPPWVLCCFFMALGV